ncbi:MAG: C69 family dipeptidase [Candidatus Eisenbacteria sp.]|nr:C69 family dipeptidase [Candidatus Eisenbacteria bacterium]
MAAGLLVLGIITFLVFTTGDDAAACTNLIVTKGASEDGSVMVTYTCDGEFHPRLRLTPAADHEPGEMIEIVDWGGKMRGHVKQVSHTYAVLYNLMNEHQVVIGETTFEGRLELQNPDGVLHYWKLMALTLQRAGTAREAVEVMTDLVEEYGYSSTGEIFSISDPEEAWVVEMIGSGPGGKGAIWVALRIPDGYVYGHSNMSRIREFPTDDPKNCLYSANVTALAIEKGYYDPDCGEPFRFCDAYCPRAEQWVRYTETRTWSMYRRIAPSKEWESGWHRGIQDAEPWPLWVKPDEKLSLRDVFDVMRDHYEGTEYDMTQGMDAGPFGCPYRWRPMMWESDGVQYSWERPISTQQTGFSMVTQSRSWLPDPVGGVLWYGVDDTYFTCYVPLYCGIDALPESYTRGGMQEFSWDSAWWVFNFVSNYACLKYSYMIEDVRKVQGELEGKAIALQPAVEKTAKELARSDPELMTRYLTDYCVSHAERVVDRWRDLGEFLLTKYNDGYVKDENGRPQEVGYPELWLRDVIRLRPDRFRLRADKDTVETELPY